MFNINLKNIRTKQGITQKQVAEHLNVSPQSISKWEKGDALPSIEFLPALAERLDCEINDFFVQIIEEKVDVELVELFYELHFSDMEDDEKNMAYKAFFNQHPDIEKALDTFHKIIKNQQIINSKNLQNILGCAEEKALIFINYFELCNYIQKMDNSDSYFVIRDNVGWITVSFKLIVGTFKFPESEDNTVEVEK